MRRQAQIEAEIQDEIELRDTSIVQPSFGFFLPHNWTHLELPEETVEWGHPDFTPVALYAAEYGPIFYLVSHRDADEDESLSARLDAAAEFEHLEIEHKSWTRLDDGTAAVECIAMKLTDAGRLRVRVTVFQRGRNLFAVTTMAPPVLWNSVETLLQRMTRSFSACCSADITRSMW
jgi:hypothetical protein